jgi:hypothetical protein
VDVLGEQPLKKGETIPPRNTQRGAESIKTKHCKTMAVIR